MNDWVEAFLTYLGEERRLSPNTLSAYRNDLRQLHEYLAGELPAASATDEQVFVGATPELVAGFVLHLRERRNHSAATVARKVAAVKSLFQFLHARHMLPTNPAAQLGAPEVKKPLPRAIPADDVVSLLEQAAHRRTPEGLRDQAMLRLLYATGMRVSELVSLDVADVDLASQRITCTGRGARRRELPVEGQAAIALGVYMSVSRGTLARRPIEALFLNHRGARLTRQGFWLIMKALAREAGISADVTPHTLRHSFAAHRLEEGVELRRLRDLLGHANLSTTQIYTHVHVAEARLQRELAGTARTSS